MNIAEKIKAGRESKGWTQIELANNSSVSLDSIKRYESKNSNITIDNLIKIADALNVDLNFFRDNEAVTKLLLSPVTKSQKNVTKLSLSQAFPNETSQIPPQTLNDDIVSIPFYEDRASAGSGAYNEAETAEQLNFPKSFLRQYFGIISFVNLSIIIGSGDSMFPTLPENCYLVIQQGNVKEGEICVARIEDELYVKRLQKLPKLKLLSDNKAYDPIELDGSNFEIIGRVVGYFKKTSL